MGVVHEPALLYGKYLVERPGYVEAYAVHVVVLFARGYLLLGEPTLVGAPELQFVAVLKRLDRTHDGAELRQLHLAYARELVMHLPLLCLELLMVWQVLPLASAAHAEMAALGRLAHFAVFYEAHHLGLAVAVLLLLHLQVYHVTRHGERHENHHVVHFGYGLALGCHIGYGDVLQQGQWPFLSAHYLYIWLVVGVQNYKISE